jgi:hypothetical protein
MTTGALLLLTVLLAPPALAWQRTFDGARHLDDAAAAVVTAPGGDVIAAGALAHGPTTGFVVVRRQGGGGTEQWRTIVRGTSPGAEEATALALDAAGDVVVVGTLHNETTGNDLSVVKLRADTGAEVWRADVNGAASPRERAHAVALDAAGDVYVAGAVWPNGNPDFAVVKLDGATGGEVWRTVLAGTAIGDEDEAITVAVDAAGNVYAGGYMTNTALAEDLTVVKLDAGGVEQWRRMVDGGAGGWDVTRRVRTSAGGALFAAGWLTSATTGSDFTVLRLDPATGGDLWSRRLDGDANFGLFEDFAYDLALVGDDVVAAGELASAATAADLTVVRLAGATGATVWQTSLDGGLAQRDVAFALAVDGADDVVAAGSFTDGGLALVKLAGATGAEAWRAMLAGELGFNAARAIAVDDSGHPVAAGQIGNTGGNHDFALLAVAGGDGAERWRVVLNGVAAGGADSGEAVVADAAGDVFVAGELETVDRSLDVAVLKLASTTGAEQWRVTLDSGTNGFDLAADIALHPTGDPVVAGWLDIAGDSTIAAVRLAGATGAERWRATVPGGSPSRIGVFPGGDVVVAGRLGADGLGLRLDGETGAERWRTLIDGAAHADDSMFALAIDEDDAVVVGGSTVNAATQNDFTVARLDGASGAERWRRVIAGNPLAAVGGGVSDLAIDAAGDVIAAGFVPAADGTDVLVAKLDRATGAVRWATMVDGTAPDHDAATALALHPTGDVLVAAQTINQTSGRDLTVLRLDGATGTERWRTPLDGSANQADHPYALVADAFGNPIAVGYLAYGAGVFDAELAIVKLAGASGVLAWQRGVRGTTGYGLGSGVTLDARGNVVATGEVLNLETLNDGTALKVGGFDGSDTLDPCATAAPLERVRFATGRSAGGIGLRLRGEVSLVAPAALDPVANGFRLLVEDESGRLLDAAIPGGGYERTSGRGWVASGHRWLYRDRARTVAGIDRIVLRLTAGSPAIARLLVYGLGDYRLPAESGRLRLTAVLSPSATPSGLCGEVLFGLTGTGTCRVAGSGERVRCREP